MGSVQPSASFIVECGCFCPHWRKSPAPANCWNTFPGILTKDGADVGALRYKRLRRLETVGGRGQSSKASSQPYTNAHSCSRSKISTTQQLFMMRKHSPPLRWPVRSQLLLVYWCVSSTFLCLHTMIQPVMSEWKNCDFPSVQIISTASCPQWWRALLQPDHITQWVLPLRSPRGFWGRRLFGPYSRGSKRRVRISWVQGPCGSYGVGGSMWKHAYQKAGALVSRSHHHQQQSMNEYEATFMNILLNVIFLFQLSFSLFFPLFQHSQIFSPPL